MGYVEKKVKTNKILNQLYLRNRQKKLIENIEFCDKFRKK